jgi:hypothetical protein
MRPFFNLHAFIAFATTLLALTGCGATKGFREGWRDNSPQQSGVSQEEACEAQDGYSWINGSCQKDSLALDDVDSATDCAKVTDAFWVDGKCLHHARLNQNQCEQFPQLKWQADACEWRVKAECDEKGGFFKDDICHDRPALSLSGPLEQSLTRSAPMQPITVTVAEGAFVKITEPSCPGYFLVSGNQITSSTTAKIPENQTSCTGRIVANHNGIESAAYDLKVTFSDGFLSLCQRMDAVDVDVLNVVLLLMETVDRNDCKSAAEVLTNSVALILGAQPRLARLEPLYGLTSLRKLLLSDHAVKDLKPLASLSSLSWLELPNGPIEDVSPLAGLKSLRYLDLAGNPIATGAVAKTEQNCPTAAGTNEAVKAFCLGQ